MSLLVRYAQRCGIEFDTAINVLTGGDLDQTVSMRAALAQRAGKTWGCAFCRVLSILVQRDHCADQFTDTQAPWFVYVRAGIAFAIPIAVVSMIARAVICHAF